MAMLLHQKKFTKNDNKYINTGDILNKYMNIFDNTMQLNIKKYKKACYIF